MFLDMLYKICCCNIRETYDEIGTEQILIQEEQTYNDIGTEQTSTQAEQTNKIKQSIINKNNQLIHKQYQNREMQKMETHELKNEINELKNIIKDTYNNIFRLDVISINNIKNSIPNIKQKYNKIEPYIKTYKNYANQNSSQNIDKDIILKLESDIECLTQSHEYFNKALTYDIDFKNI